MGAVGPFCSNCGAPQAGASAFCSRCGHALAPVAAGQSPALGQTTWAVATPIHVASSHPHKTSGLLPWLLAGGGVFVLLVTLATVTIVSQALPLPGCQGICGGPPPKSPPLAAPHIYTSKTFGYSVAYYDVPSTVTIFAGDQAPKLVRLAVRDDRSIGWTMNLDGIDWPYTVEGERAGGRSAQKVVQDLAGRIAPQATFVYQIPDGGLGYNSGYGAVYDLVVRSANGQTLHARMLLLASVKGDTAVELVAYGPYTEQSTGHPNPARTLMVFVVTDIVNGVTIPGQGPAGS